MPVSSPFPVNLDQPIPTHHIVLLAGVHTIPRLPGGAGSHQVMIM